MNTPKWQTAAICMITNIRTKHSAIIRTNDHDTAKRRFFRRIFSPSWAHTYHKIREELQRDGIEFFRWGILDSFIYDANDPLWKKEAEQELFLRYKKAVRDTNPHLKLRKGTPAAIERKPEEMGQIIRSIGLNDYSIPQKPAVYVLTNRINKKRYIGATSTLYRTIGQRLFTNKSNFSKGMSDLRSDIATVGMHNFNLEYYILKEGDNAKEIKSSLMERLHPEYNSCPRRKGEQQHERGEKYGEAME